MSPNVAIRAFLCGSLLSACELSETSHLDEPAPPGLDAGQVADGGLSEACSSGEFGDRALESELIILVQDGAGASVAGATLRVTNGEEEVLLSTDLEGCARLEAERFLTEQLAIEAQAHGYVPAMRLGDPLALQIVHLHEAGTVLKPVATGVVRGTVPNFEVVNTPGSAPGRTGVVSTIRSNIWTVGAEADASGDWPKNMIQYREDGAFGGNHLEFELILRLGEHAGISVAAGPNIDRREPDFDETGPPTWLGWIPLSLSPGDNVERTISLTVPLTREARVSFSDHGFTSGYWIYGFVDAPQIGFVEIPPVYDHVLELGVLSIPRFIDDFQGARFGALAVFMDGARSVRERIQYAASDDNLDIQFNSEWQSSRAARIRDHRLHFIGTRDRANWTICQIQIIDSSKNILAIITDYTAENTLPLPRVGAELAERIRLPAQVQLETTCARHPGWQPGFGRPIAHRNERWTFIENIVVQ